MRSNINQHISIAKHIVDGSITIDSIEEFKSILRIFPNDPALHRVFADLLVRKKNFETAMSSYSKAATLNIESGMMLQAIICKILEWRLKKPNRQKAERFYRALSGGRYHQTPLNVFFSGLTFEEFSGLVNQMTRVRVAVGKTVQKMGEQEKDLYLIVSGTLKATTILPLDKMQDEPQKTTVYLTENDFFGNIYPFETEKICQAFVETITNAELVKTAMYQDIKNARIRISMESDAMTVSVVGKIVWSKEVAVEAEKTVALGIQYMNMTPKLSGLLVVFADILHAAG